MTSSKDIEIYREGLSAFIDSCQGDLTPVTSSRVIKAREKLRKLTRVQFIDLSIDVYDELQRRNLVSSGSMGAPRYLEPDNTYHPKRNQARQKLAALPAARFKDLVNDVLFEINNRKVEGTLVNKKAINNDDLELNQQQQQQSRNKMGLNLNTAVPIPASSLSPLPLPSSDSSPSIPYRTPINETFANGNGTGEETPSQMKSTTLVPQKAELTWSSDEEDDIKENSKNSALLRSPSKKINIATNEVLNEHAGPGLKFPVDEDDNNDQIDFDVLKSQIANLEIENSILKGKESQLQEKIDELNELEMNNLELKEKVQTLTLETDKLKDDLERYKGLEGLEQEHQLLLQKHSAQTEQVEELQRIVNNAETQKKDLKNEFDEDLEDDDDDDEDGERSEKDDEQDHRELVALKAYLEKVLEQNEKLKNDIEGKDSLMAELEEVKQRNETLLKESEDLKNRVGTFNVQDKSFDDSSDWKEKYDDLKLGKFKEALKSIDGTIEARLFNPRGMISVANLAIAYSTLDSIFTYLSGIDLTQFQPITLFDKVSKFIKYANIISKEASIVKGSNSTKIEEIQRILISAIANALSITRQYATYYQILPKLVLHVALCDIYLTICDLVGLVKINGDGIPNNELTQGKKVNLLKLDVNAIGNDEGNITTPIDDTFYKYGETPMAFKMGIPSNNGQQGISIDPNGSQASLGSPIGDRSRDDITTSVRPLRITQRLAQGESRNNLSMDQQDSSFDRSMNAPTIQIPGRVSSPSNRKTGLNSPIPLQMAIVVPGKDTSPVKNNNILPDYIKPPGIKNGVMDKIKQFNTSVDNDIGDNNGSKSSLTSPIRVNGNANEFNGRRDDDHERELNIKGDHNSMKLNFESPNGGKAKNDIDVENNENRHEEEGKSEVNGKQTDIKHVSENGKDVPLVQDLNVESSNSGEVKLPSTSLEEIKSRLDTRVEKVNKYEKVEDKIEPPSIEKETDFPPNSVGTPMKNNDNSKDKSSFQPSSKPQVPVMGQLQSPFGKQVEPKSFKDIGKSFESDLNDKAIDQNGKEKDNDNEFESPFEKKIEEEPDFNKDIEQDPKSIKITKEDSNPFIEKSTNLKLAPPFNPQQHQAKSEGENQKAIDKKEVVSPIKSETSLLNGLNTSALEIDEKMARRVSRRLSRRLSTKQPLPFVPSDHDEEEEEGEKEEENLYEEDEDDDDDFDIEKFNTLNPDNTLHELLLYLEHQTVEVINAIQKTLGSIKNPKATRGLLREGANEINSVVKAMAEGTSTLMNQSRYAESMGHARYVVEVLEDCVKRMEGLYGDDTSKDEEYAGKNFKQRSAGIAFDVARSTKELVKTVEEASLRDEIAVLDSRLNNSVSASIGRN